MNRTKQKQAKRAQAAQLASIMEMRGMVHRIAEALYVAGYPTRTPDACIRAGIAFVDALNAFVPTPVSVEDRGPEPGSEAEMEAHS